MNVLMIGATGKFAVIHPSIPQRRQIMRPSGQSRGQSMN